MKKVLLSILIIVAFIIGFSNIVNAETTDEYFYYVLNKDGTGYSVFIQTVHSSSLTEITIPQTYEGLPVLEINSSCFSGFDVLETVVIPEGITTIGDRAFENCYKLKNITLPSTLTTIGANAFYSCGDLENINLPDNLTTIGANAFYFCNSLQNITIPNSVTEIGNGAFQYCMSVTEITLNNGLTKIGDNAFFQNELVESIIVPSTVTELGEGAFGCCAALKNITLNEGLKKIGAKAFLVDKGIESITVPSTVTEIGANAFEGCTGLTQINLSEGLKILGSNAFKECKALTEIILPAELTKIEDGTFSSAILLKKVTIPEGIKEIGSLVFDGTAIESITIPKSMETIAQYTFASTVTIYGYRNTAAETFAEENGNEFIPLEDPSYLTYEMQNGNLKYIIVNEATIQIMTADGDFSGKLSIPNEIQGYPVTEVYNKAFKNCTGITEIEFPKNLKKIGKEAFDGCTGLSNVVIPEELEEVENGVFNNCTNLKQITIPVTINRNVNYGYSIYKNSKDLKSQTYGSIVDNCPALESINLTYGTNGVMTDFYVINPYNNLRKEGLFAPWMSSTCPVYNVSEEVVSYGSGAFAACSGMKEFTIPDHITTIPYAGFYACTSLTKLQIPDSITSIGSYAFGGDNNLEEIRLPSSLLKVGDLPFFFIYNKAVKIYIPSTTFEGAEDSSFLRLDHYNGISITATYYVFKGSFFGDSDTYNYREDIDCSYLIENSATATVTGSLVGTEGTSVVIPEKLENYPVTKIRENAFADLTNITSITIPESVTQIDSTAFLNHNENLVIYGVKGSYAETFANENDIQFNELIEYTTKDTEDVTIGEEESAQTVTVMPVVKETEIEDFLTVENFPIIGTYTVEVYDASGNLKETGNLGSRNIIQITDENGNVLEEFTVIVPGDITGNGLSRMYDAFQILKDTIIPGTTLDAIDIKIRDYNNDGNVRMYDAFQFLKEAILGK